METVTIQIPENLPADLVKQKIVEFEAGLQEEIRRRRLAEDEKDLDEKTLNDAVRSVLRDSEILDKLNSIDKSLTDSLRNNRARIE